MTDEENELLAVIYVQATRTLDVLYLIAEKMGADVESLMEYHRNGGLISPEPWISEEAGQTQEAKTLPGETQDGE